MKIQKLKKVLTILLAIMLLALLKNSSLGYSMTMSLKSSDYKLESDKEYTITASIDSIDAGNGVDTIVAKFDYDINVFDKSATEAVSVNGWNPIYDEDTGVIIIQRSKKINEGTVFLKINLKTKDVSNFENTPIYLNNIQASGGVVSSGGTGDFELGNVGILIEKNGNVQNNTQTNQGNQENENQNNNSNNSNNPNNSNGSNESNNSANQSNQEYTNEKTQNQGISNSQNSQNGNASNLNSNFGEGNIGSSTTTTINNEGNKPNIKTKNNEESKLPIILIIIAIVILVAIIVLTVIYFMRNKNKIKFK